MKDQLTISELQSLIIEWARAKNLNDPDKQYLKILEEIGETARAILKNDVPEIKDGIGDIAVTLIIYFWQNNERLEWEEESYEKKSVKECFQDIIKETEDLNGYILNYVDDLAQSQNTTLTECLNLAWNVIKDRQGKTVNGTFIKA